MDKWWDYGEKLGCHNIVPFALITALSDNIAFKAEKAKILMICERLHKRNLITTIGY
jgi:hypothetical protein